MQTLLLLPKKTVFFIGGLLFLCLFLLWIGISFFRSNETTQNQLILLQVSPSSDTLLLPQTKQTFTLTFSLPVSASEISVVATEQIVVTNQQQKIALLLKQNSSSKTLTTSPIAVKPYAQYTLVVLQKATGKTLAGVSYQTLPPQPTRAPTNNLFLSQYLPYETETYRLSYWKEKNVYVFNFKYNPSSSDDTQTQFEKAQNDAKTFIQSKGIPLDSIIINWLFH